MRDLQDRDWEYETPKNNPDWGQNLSGGHDFPPGRGNGPERA